MADADEQLVGADVEIERRHAACVVSLSRPKALNALTDEMRAAIAAELAGLARDPIIYALVIQAPNSRMFCAGGDVRQLVASLRLDPALARKSFADEYALNWQLECFPKPSIALMNGFSAGSGNGLTQYATHRVGGPGYQFAMPETAIGLFPDVGVSHRLSRLPDEVGTYLALTGNTLGRVDAYRLGLLTHLVSEDALEQISAGLSDADPVDALIGSLHAQHDRDVEGGAELGPLQSTIKAVFAGDDLLQIFARLKDLADGSDPHVAQWSTETLETLGSRSPIALWITLRHIRNVAKCDIRETLIGDYRIACHVLDNPDFVEGVRAMLIDKDKAPRWQHESVSDVSESEVDRYFEPHESGDLELPQRAEAQKLFR